MLLLLLSALALSTALAQEGILELDVRTGDGEPIPAKEVRIETFAPRDFSDFGTRWQDTRRNLRYGEYRVKVQALGFKTETQMVDHRDPITKVRVGLSVGSVDAPLPSVVRIKAEPVPDAERDVWVRLFPLHSGEFSSSRRLRPDGTLDFELLDAAPYLLVVVETTGAISGETVRLLASRIVQPRYFDDTERDIIEIEAVK